MTDFSEVSTKYEKDSMVQRTASDYLFELLRIKPSDDVLDIGCGTGNLTARISLQAKGKLIGIDPSEGMINQAIQNYSHRGIEFEVCPAEKLNYADSFDVIFCNSAFHWFKDHKLVLEACWKALKPGGRMGIQAPARKWYSPNFVRAVERVKTDPVLEKQFSSFQPPWLLFDTSEEYIDLFETAGFEVLHSRIDEIVSNHTVEEVYKNFDSAAVAGYLNQEFYSLPISDDYVDAFRSKVKEAFGDQANSNGQVALTFFRLYLLARKPYE